MKYIYVIPTAKVVELNGETLIASSPGDTGIDSGTIKDGEDAMTQRQQGSLWDTWGE